MTTFKYKGITSDGAKVSGIVSAYNEYEAVSKLRESISIVTQIDAVPEKKTPQPVFGPRKIKDKELSIMCSQFGIILTSGMPIVRCVEMVASQSSDKQIHQMLDQVAQDVSAGYSLTQSFEKYTTVLPVTFIETVRAGEASGMLEQSFQKLEKYYDSASKTRDKVKNTLSYPIIVLVVAVIVAAIIMLKAVPLFKKTFEELGTELPLPTKILIGLSDFFVAGWPYILVVIAAAYIALKMVKRTENGRLKLARFKVTKAPLKSIHLMNGASQFANTLSTMLTAGLPVSRALEVTARVINNYALSKAISHTVDGVEQGRQISECMREEGLFPPLLVEMTGVGEQTGSIEQTLDVIGSYYDNEVNLKTTRLLTALEPAITIGLAVITVLLLLALYLPMFNMYGTIQ